MSAPPQPKVVSVGGMGLDIICHNFPLEEFSPEREVVGAGYELLPGGSAVNFACTMASLGLATALVGKTGADLHAKTVQSLVEDAGVDFRAVASPDVQTNMSVNYNGPSGETIMTTVGNANRSMTAEDVLPAVRQLLAGAHYLYFGGCLKLTGLLPALPALAREARSLGVTVVVDHGRVFGRLSEDNRSLVRELCVEADFYLPSVDELTKLWNASSVEDAARKVSSDCKNTLIVKDGGNGVTAFVDDERILANAYGVEVGNPVGAGDTFNAGFVRAHSAGMSLAECLDFGCAAAAVKISRPGRPTYSDVQALRSSR